MIKCVVVDDEPLAIALLNQYIRRYKGLEMMDGFTDALESISYINNNHIDILFLDILMPDITGIGVLKKLTGTPVVIFTTAHRDFAVDGYEMGVADYLLKPFDFERFKIAVERAIERIRLKDKDNSDLTPGVFVKSDYKLIKINFQDVVYVESMDDYIRIYVQEGKPVITLMSLKSFLEKLPAPEFQRVHRRYIVAMNKINSLETRRLILKTGVEIPVGDTYQEVIQHFKNQHQNKLL
ncbi:MAG: response regulator transcription factor [Chitinophagaceae bacterium]|nr:response regulator transcription factor [Chitinophagaceae bacterium]